MDFYGTALKLDPGAIVAAGASYNLPPAMLHAVWDVESGGAGFLPDRRPTILFERHLFHRYTDGKFDATHPGISNVNAGGYGAGGAHQYDRINEAMTCDEDAALRAASWGAFQVLGSNFEMIGYPSPAAMVTDFMIGEGQHLEGFLKYCEAANCARYLRQTPPDFDAFARAYNGPNYAASGYQLKLAGSFNKWLKAAPKAAPPIPAPRTDPEAFAGTIQLGSSGPMVTQIQKWLGASGYMITGKFGIETDAAVRAFQTDKKISVDGVVGKITWGLLRIPLPV